MPKVPKSSVKAPVVSAQVSGPGPTPILLCINQLEYRLSVEPRRSLLDVLREDLGLTGAKRVCNLGECGACTVLLDGQTIYSCLTLAVECAGHVITTVEGLGTDGKLDPVQEAFIRRDAVQCGFCTPGQVLAARALLTDTPCPSITEIQHGMAGNLCRCGTYTHIVEAIQDVATGTGSDSRHLAGEASGERRR